MIRTVAYSTIFTMMVLTGANLAMSHALATDGGRLTELDNHSKRILEEMATLEKNIAKARSVNVIISKAENLGFTEPVKQKSIRLIE